MIDFKRKYPVGRGKRGIVIAAGIFLFLVAWNGIFIVSFPKLAEAAIIGPHFVFAHLWALFGIFFMIISIKTIIKPHPGSKIACLEVEAYNQRYAASFPPPKKKYPLLLGVLFSTLIVPGFYLFILFKYVPENLNAGLFLMMHIAMFLLMSSLFYKTVLKARGRSEVLMVKVFDHINKKLPDTNIKLVSSNFNHALYSSKVQMGINIKGTFRGHEFKIKHSVRGIKYPVGASMSSEGGIELYHDNKTGLEFTVSEFKDLPNKFKAVDLNDAFKKRFELKGVGTQQLPELFKQTLLDFSGMLNLTVKKNVISQTLAGDYISPFYSGQGVVLFLDYLLDLAKMLARGKK